MQDSTPNFDNVIFLKFEDSKLPEFKEIKNKDWIYFGEEDNYPDYLLLLLNKSSKHCAIINGKVNYIYGQGLKSLSNNPALNAWIEKCNHSNEGMNELAIKSIKDCEVFGGFYWQIIPDRTGRIADIYHIPYKNIRAGKDRDMFYYKENWSDRKEALKPLPKYVKGMAGAGIFCFKEYRQGNNTYALPNYLAAINYIEADFEVSKQTLSNAKCGFSASKMINFFNGEPPEDEKKKIEKRFSMKFSGSEGSKMVISFNNDPTKAPQILDLGTSDLTKEDFNAVDNLITSNIYAGHQINSPTLFGIAEAGKLGNSNELKYAYDIFKNTYSNFKQKQFESVINFFAEMIFGIGDFKLQDVEPISLQFDAASILAIAPKEWLWDKLGIDPAKYPLSLPAAVPAAGGPAAPVAPAQQAADPVNDNIKNLSAKQHQQLMRIIRQFSKGQLTEAAAKALLKTGLGLSDADINPLLGIEEDAQFEKEFTEEEVAGLFLETGFAADEYEIIKTKKANFSEDEFTSDDILEVKMKVMDTVKTALPNIAIRYSYDKRPEATGPSVLPTTRLFCKKLAESNKVFSREQINKISAAVGYSVWERKGGFWTMPNGEHSPSCRHIWNSHIVIKKINSN